MQPNIVSGNRTQLGQYPTRSGYGYDVPATAYRPNQRSLSNSTMVHPNTAMGCMSNNYAVGAPGTLFPNLLTANICNVSDAVQILQPIPAPIPVKFRTLPFYKLKYEILKPSAMNANNQITLPANVKTSATQEFQFAFVMTCAMASELALNRDVSKNEYIVQAQIRITAIDVSTAARPAEYDDFLPMGLVIRVNNRQCTQLPPCSPCSRQGQETRRIPRPISVTHLIKISPMNANVLTINWAAEAGRQYVISMNVVEKLSSEFLLNSLKDKPRIPVDGTKFTIRQQYRPIDGEELPSGKMTEDEDISTTILRVSLLCPLAKFRMQYPAKGKYCTHLQCFDGSAYISLNEKKPMWNCPVCNKALHYDDLLLDEYFMDVLRNDELSPDCQEVQLLIDGSWKSYFEDAPAENKDADPTKSNSQQDRRQSTNSPDENAKGKVSSTSESAAEGIVSNSDVVNLLSDDDDDDEYMSPNEVFKDATVADKDGNSTNGEVPTATATATTEVATNEREMSNGEVGQDQQNKMETDEEVQRTPSEPSETSTAAMATAAVAAGTNKEGNPMAGIISLDSPSPPAPAVADLNIRND